MALARSLARAVVRLGASSVRCRRWVPAQGCALSDGCGLPGSAVGGLAANALAANEPALVGCTAFGGARSLSLFLPSSIPPSRSCRACRLTRTTNRLQVQRLSRQRVWACLLPFTVSVSVSVLMCVWKMCVCVRERDRDRDRDRDRGCACDGALNGGCGCGGGLWMEESRGAVVHGVRGAAGLGARGGR
eukprot:3468979-Rhodomonas_salina.1